MQQITTNPQEYIQDRWNNQKEYYSKKSAFNKQWHQILSLFSQLGTIAVPVLLLVPNIWNIIPAIISALVAAAYAAEKIFKFGDNWRNYRLTLEFLKREKQFFIHKVKPYDDPSTAFPVFVERIENAIASETTIYFPTEDKSSAKSTASTSL